MKTQMMALIFLLVVTIIYWGLILIRRDKDNLLMGLAMIAAVVIFGFIVLIAGN